MAMKQTAKATLSPRRSATGAAQLDRWLREQGRGALTRLAARVHCGQSHLSDIRRGVKYASGALAFELEAATGIPARLFVAPRAA